MYNYTYQMEALEAVNKVNTGAKTVDMNNLEFLPIGNRLIKLTYSIDMFLTVGCMLKIYLIARAFLHQTFFVRPGFQTSY